MSHVIMQVLRPPYANITYERKAIAYRAALVRQVIARSIIAEALISDLELRKRLYKRDMSVVCLHKKKGLTFFDVKRQTNIKISNPRNELGKTFLHSTKHFYIQ